MAKAKKARKAARPSIADRAMMSVREAGSYLRGESTPGLVVKEPVDVAAIRAKTNLSQPAFASKYGIPVGTLRDWEQNRKSPERMARIFLRVIAMNPKLAEEAAQEETAA